VGCALGYCSFPLVERAVADVPALADPDFVAGIRRHAESLVWRSQGGAGTFSLLRCVLILSQRELMNTLLHRGPNFGFITGTYSRGRSLTAS
jgi:hypothetical protein